MDTRLALCDVRGPLTDFLEKLSGEDGDRWLREFNKFLRKEEVWRTDFVFDMTKEGWTLLEDAREPWPISIANLEMVSLLKGDESYVDGEEMVRRARKELNSNLGQRQAEFLLEHQADIPEEFRKYYLIFPGTIWRGRGGNRDVPYLGWFGGQWRLDLCWLGHNFRDRYRLVRPRE